MLSSVSVVSQARAAVIIFLTIQRLNTGLVGQFFVADLLLVRALSVLSCHLVVRGLSGVGHGGRTEAGGEFSDGLIMTPRQCTWYHR